MRMTIGSFVLMASAMPSAAGMIVGPSPYLSVADSPFAGFDMFALEDFEDGVFDLAGVSASVGTVIASSSVTDSVDADDGNIDGSGTMGRSFFSSNGSVGITFTFDTGPDAPVVSAAGLVWTDGSGTVTFEAYDRDGALIGTVEGTHFDGSFGGATGEDRFYGVVHAGGIGSIFIRNQAGGIEIDHLQYGVPGPASALLLALPPLFRRRRSRAARGR